MEKHNLHGRVELLGGLSHDKVRDVLCRGHIFLNTSLTESFCIAILEAACCGLLVVTTDVGGVPEVLPPHMAYLAKPEEKSIVRQLGRAIQDVKDMDCESFHDELAKIYSWRKVAEKTERVYDSVMQAPVPNILDRIKSSYAWGPAAGIWAILFTILEALVLFILEMIWPEEDIDIARDFDLPKYSSDWSKFGDHLLYVDTKDSRTVPKPCTDVMIDQDYQISRATFNRERRYTTVK